MRTLRHAVLPALILLFAAACAPNFPTLQPEAEQPAQVESDPTGSEPTASSAPADTPTDTTIPTEEPTAAILPTDTLIPAPTTGAAAEECPFRPELHATNPSGVALASGEVQLVEFFAFW
jgi:hypothetical protein